jgi:hypothetical protein
VAGDLVQGRRAAISFGDGRRRSRSGTADGDLVQERRPATSSRNGGRRALQGRRRSRPGAPALIAADPAQALIALVKR